MSADARKVRVRASESGFPLEVSLSREALRLGGAYIAAEVVRQCQAAALKSGAQYRESCREAGVSSATLAALSVPSSDDVAAREATEPGATALHRWGFSR